MTSVQCFLVCAVLALVRPAHSGFLSYRPSSTSAKSANTSTKGDCPAKPAGISSFRPAAGTRLYYAWSTVQGSARTAFLSNALCRGGKILNCSCMGYDVTGYNRASAELQEGFAFGLNKKLKVGDLFHFTRTWTKAGDYHLKCHYDTDFQYGSGSKSPSTHDKRKKYSNRATGSSSLYGIWSQNATASQKINIFSKAFKVLSWTSTEVVFYDCASADPDIRIYTTYVPTKSHEIPYSVFDILTQLGININSLRWIKLDHKDCVYPNTSTYHKILAGLTPSAAKYAH